MLVCFVLSFFSFFFCLNGLSPRDTRTVHDRYDRNENWQPGVKELSGDGLHFAIGTQHHIADSPFTASRSDIAWSGYS